MLLVHALGLAVPAASLLYQIFATWAVSRHREPAPGTPATPPITVLKPVHGFDVGLYQNLASFCEQDYPKFQVIFAAASASDPAVTIVRQVIADHPDRDLSLVIDDTCFGANKKMSNVTNAMPRVRHDLLVIADSDMRVTPNYLQSIARAFEPDDVGAVTCLYTGSPDDRLASKLNSLYINDSFLPSILVALRLDELTYCFGATMAIRRSVLEEIGGLAQFSYFLADDYMLGKLVSDRGYRVALAPVVVENIVHESDLKSLLRHELRWARTVRTVRPVGYALSILTQSVPLALLGWLVCGTGHLGAALFAIALPLRVLLHQVVRWRFAPRGSSAMLLIPLREAMNLLVWAMSFLSSNVEWRGNTFAVARNGHMSEKGVTSP